MRQIPIKAEAHGLCCSGEIVVIPKITEPTSVRSSTRSFEHD